MAAASFNLSISPCSDPKQKLSTQFRASKVITAPLENRITKDAKARSERMIKEATEYTRNLRDGARSYSIELLDTAESTLAELLAEVRNNKSQL